VGVFFYDLIYNVGDMKDTTPYPIDFLVPFVNNQDIKWRNTFIDYCKKHNLNEKIVELLGSRYGGITFIYDQLQLVRKNMPWINKIYLILSNKEQIIPSLLPPNCEIVLHEQFIPWQYLPTFNSTTIEMFLWNIKGLSEHFIYANDDMLPIGKLEPSDFFENDQIKIEWRKDTFYACSNVYSYQCHNNCMSLVKKLGVDFDKDTMLRPVHSFTPMIKSHCKECFNLIKEFVLPKIRAFRTQYQHNQYIYPLYEYFKYGTLDSQIDFLYTELKEDFDFNHQIICVNCETKQEYVDKYRKEIRQLCEL
jgi:hypothetical protein